MTMWGGSHLFDSILSYQDDIVGSIILFESLSNSGKTGRYIVGKICKIFLRVGDSESTDSFVFKIQDAVYKNKRDSEWVDLDTNSFSVSRDCKNDALYFLSTSEAVTLILTKDYDSLLAKTR